MSSRPHAIVFIVRDPLPPLRADVLTLFGREMPRHGINTELVGQRGDAAAGVWPGGGMHAIGSLAGRFGGILAFCMTPLWDALGLLRAWRRVRPDCIQVRDKVASAVLALLAARVLRIPFVYWMSFPIVEGYEVRRDALARRRRGLTWLGHALRAAASRRVLHRLLLPRSDHLFVQSEAMRNWLAGQGVPLERMTAVPMGVDAATFERHAIVPAQDVRLEGRRVLLYLGRIAQSRRSEFLLEVAQCLRVQLPASLLVIAGDAPSKDEMTWMRDAIAARGLGEHVLLTGWLPQDQALGYAVRAEVGLSPIPRGTLFDVSSPTKLVEYLALGIPGVANDIPDQAQVIAESGAGLCVPMQACAFAEAALRIMNDPALAARCAARGPAWVRTHRSYDILAQEVARTYQRILPGMAPPPAPCGSSPVISSPVIPSPIASPVEPQAPPPCGPGR